LQSALKSYAERHRGALLLATTLWTASGIILYVWFPLLSPAILLLAPLAPMVWQIAATPRLVLQKPSALIVALLLAGLYLTLNASWSLSPSSSHLTLGMYFAAIAASYFVLNALPDCDADALRAMAIGLYVGTVVGAAVLCVDVLSYQWPRRTLMSLVPVLRSKARDMAMEDGWVTFLQPFLLNRSISAAMFMFWPVLLAISLLSPTPRRRGWWLIGLVPAVAAIFASEHATSKIAFVGAAVAFVLFQVSPVVARRAIALGWIAIVVLVIPAATLAYQHQLYLSTWLAQSARHRIVIWGYTSQLYPKAPILGAGINTARALNDPLNYDAPLAPGSGIRLTTSLHSHNDYLQVWYEAGAVGAVFLLAIGLIVLRSAARAPAHAQPYLHATFVACALLGGSSFSLWQPWFMASFIFVAGAATVGRTLAARSLPARSLPSGEISVSGIARS